MGDVEAVQGSPAVPGRHSEINISIDNSIVAGDSVFWMRGFVVMVVPEYGEDLDKAEILLELRRIRLITDWILSILAVSFGGGVVWLVVEVLER